MPIPVMILYMAVAGALVGLVSSFFGVGACFIMVPTMIYCFEHFMDVSPSLSPLIAFGTNMAVVVPTALSGVLRHRLELHRRGLAFPLRHYIYFALPVGLGGVTGSVFAFVFFTSFRAHAGIALKTLFGFFCLIGAYRFMRARPIPVEEAPRASPLRFGVVGYLSGILAHFIGIGGGIIYMPMLNTVLRMPVHLSVPLSLATMVVGSSVGALSFIALGHIDQVRHPADYPPLSVGWFNLAAFLTIGVASILLAQVGPLIAHRTEPRRFKMLLALVYVYIGLRLVINGLCQLMGMPRLIP
ncbi:MAG: hypothetical protein AYL28_000480 [Candidatus Bathyarchaeota archaeon B23]|nr:MAG: hypothetical protein AYL28_000480 [Candidatus Bathyarchaeota archaeon B23]